MSKIYIVKCGSHILGSFTKRKRARKYVREMPQGDCELKIVETTLDELSIPREKIYMFTWRDYYCDGKDTPHECFESMVVRKHSYVEVLDYNWLDIAYATLCTCRIIRGFPMELYFWCIAKNVNEAKTIVNEKLRTFHPKEGELEWSVYKPLLKDNEGQEELERRIKRLKK